MRQPSDSNASSRSRRDNSRKTHFPGALLWSFRDGRERRLRWTTFRYFSGRQSPLPSQLFFYGQDYRASSFLSVLPGVRTRSTRRLARAFSLSLQPPSLSRSEEQTSELQSR